MKKRTISKLKSLFSSKKGKRQQEQQHSAKSSRSPSPDSGPASPAESETFHPIQRTPPPSRVGPPPSPPVPTTPVAPVAPEPPGPLSLLPCQVCGRTFVQQSLAKHVKICEKMTVKKRKTFDSSRQRREGVTAPDSRSGTDLEQYLPKNFGLPENSPFLEKSPPQVVKATPKPKVQSVRSAIMKPTADLQKCPHCSRAFGVRAFERHVEWCADKAKILPAAPAQPPPHIADAKQRLNARTQYKAPPVRGRRSSQSRDKSSLSRSASVESTRGVSPAPPREYGDYRHGRTRASESLSSNDCIDDSPHMPVIRNSRAPQNNSSGDANVKARQARLARDLSNSRRQEQTKASTIQSSTAPGPSKVDKNLKVRLDTKRRQQLKRLDEIANKYKERENMRENDKSNSKNKNKVAAKSQIPLPKNPEVTERKSFSDNIRNKPNIRNANNIKRMRDLKCDKKDMDKESTMSLDSLDENIVNKNSPKDFKEDMLCPCVPCVIHENNEPILNVAKKRIDTVEEAKKELKDSNVSPKIRVLFKNKKFHSDKQKKETMKSKTIVEKNQNFIDTENGLDLRNFKENQSVKGKLKLDPQVKVDLVAQTDAAAKRNIKDLNKEHTGLEIIDQENINYLDSRHGSGETYTKFTENPADLDEFFTITDQMINKQQHDELNNNIARIEKDIDELHTPQTDSLETLNTDFVPNEDANIKPQFSNALDVLKQNFKDLMLEINKDSLPPVSKEPNCVQKNPVAKCEKENISIENIDMEHITVYEFKHKQMLPEKSAIKENSQLKLPYITDTKNNTKYPLNKKKINKGNRKNKMLSLQKRASKNYQTFIINNEDTNESNDDAPPLKLPRIENKSSNNIAGEKFFPSSVKRSTSLLDSIQKKTKTETSKSRQSVDKLEDDIMQSLKDFDKFYESQKNDNGQMNKEMSSSNKNLYHDTIKRDARKKNESKAKTNKASNGNCTPNGKASNDSAYSRLVSLNRISPSKLSLCKENGVASLDRIPAGSDTSSGHKDDLQSISSDEFLAMERTAELTVTEQSDVFKDVGKTDKNSKSRESARASPTWRRKEALSSSSSETSIYRTTKESSPAPRLSRFCHECGSKFPVDTAKFCIECGVKRLVV
ncbi:uncharacterized protein LOC121735153 isoform X7 [Aricia agestis]|uniref:uncharacterized protein LOC121735153 isoform X7 n=1 Tax=Aricia agestis TaxID=91739 RepID=UPI001C205679|nr:uncharacterized protein LOC121735153 isoform X7 [Aricia agestis]